MLRKILHLDMDAFFCSIEELHNPTLKGKAFAVGRRPDQRGVVASCSYAARQFGVHSAMPMAQAVKLCPELIIVPHRMGAYRQLSRQIMAYLNTITPLVEQLSIDEAFLDVSTLPQSAEAIAHQIQQGIRSKFNLPCSLGAASNKLVAKIANTVGKSKVQHEGAPNAIQVVLPGQEAAFLAPLSVRYLWGVGPKTAEQLAALGIHTIGDLANWSEVDLTKRFGKHGYDLGRRARGIDDRPIQTEAETKSISLETTFERNVSDHETLRQTLLRFSEGVGQQLRKEGLKGTTIKLKLRWADFSTITRQMTLPDPTDQDIDIYQASLHLFEHVWITGKPVRLLGVGVSNFATSARQLTLFDNPTASGKAVPEPLKATLDQLRQRYGDKAIRRGSTLKK